MFLVIKGKKIHFVLDFTIFAKTQAVGTAQTFQLQNCM